MRSQETGKYTRLETVAFGSWNGSAYVLSSSGESADRVYNIPLMPGVYDAVYLRGGTLSGGIYYEHVENDSYPIGEFVLGKDIVVGPGANTIDMDMAPAMVNGALLFNGTTSFPNSGSSSTIYIYVRSQETGKYTRLETVAFGSWNGSAYVLSSSGESADRVYNIPLMPGVYDAVHMRGGTLSGGLYYEHVENDSYPIGEFILKACVAIE